MAFWKWIGFQFERMWDPDRARAKIAFGRSPKLFGSKKVIRPVTVPKGQTVTQVATQHGRSLKYQMSVIEDLKKLLNGSQDSILKSTNDILFMCKPEGNEIKALVGQSYQEADGQIRTLLSAVCIWGTQFANGSKIYHELIFNKHELRSLYKALAFYNEWNDIKDSKRLTNLGVEFNIAYSHINKSTTEFINYIIGQENEFKRVYGKATSAEAKAMLDKLYSKVLSIKNDLSKISSLVQTIDINKIDRLINEQLDMAQQVEDEKLRSYNLETARKKLYNANELVSILNLFFQKVDEIDKHRLSMANGFGLMKMVGNPKIISAFEGSIKNLTEAVKRFNALNIPSAIQNVSRILQKPNITQDDIARGKETLDAFSDYRVFIASINGAIDGVEHELRYLKSMLEDPKNSDAISKTFKVDISREMSAYLGIVEESRKLFKQFNEKFVHDNISHALDHI